MTKLTIEERFWAKVDKNGPTMPHMQTPCWAWTAAKDARGYGVFQLNRITHKAHRLAYEWTNNTALGDLFGCHDCDNPSCVRPDHIWPGTADDNAKDRKRKGHAIGPHNHHHGGYKLPKGSNAGERSSRHKLTQQQVDEIRARWEPRVVTHAMLATEYGVSKHTIRHITNGATWNLNGRYVGSRETYRAAEAELDRLAFEALARAA
jgi:hypothetical protein